MSELNELLSQVQDSAFPEKTSKLSAEIARLMREGSEDCRKKARGLLQSAIDERSATKAVA
ncbi:MAG: hypothetical protein ACYCUY_01375 [Acidithiobacillus sp.]